MKPIGLDWVANFEKSRWFLVLRLQSTPHESLNKSLHICNSAVQQYGQPPLYTKPLLKGSAGLSKIKVTAGKKHFDSRESNPDTDDVVDVSDAFHISVAWTLEPPSQEFQDVTTSLVDDHFEDMRRITVNVSEIKVKVGNVVTNLLLPTSILEGRSLFSG